MNFAFNISLCLSLNCYENKRILQHTKSEQEEIQFSCSKHDEGTTEIENNLKDLHNMHTYLLSSYYRNVTTLTSFIVPLCSECIYFNIKMVYC